MITAYEQFSKEYSERQQQLINFQKALSLQCSELKILNESLRLEVIDYKHKAHYWEAQFGQLKSREELLKAEVEELKAKLRKREQQLFGKSSEKNTSHSELGISSLRDSAKKKRGQQPGSVGHGRRDYSELPTIEEIVSLADGNAHCPCCGLAYEELPGSSDCEILEVINVKAYRRLVRRKMHKRRCACKANSDSQIITPPPVEKILPKGKIGNSIWALILLNKFEYQQPIYRTLEQLRGYGLSLAMGTIVDGLQKLLPFFIPIYDAIVERSIAAKHWHADETGWKVFETKEGKINHRWYLWIFHNAETVVYKIDPTRSSKVLLNHFGKDHPGGVLNVDRYAAYKVIAKSGCFILAFCWAHVRRDFLNYSKEYVANEAWGLEWVEKINELYHINNQRIQHEENTSAFKEFDQALRTALSLMERCCDEQLKDTCLLPSAQKLLVRLNKHWKGLIVFLEEPNIPMDNNTAERGLRSSVVGRKNYYGSGAIWSAELAAVLFSLFETLKLSKLNVHTWLLAYLQECAMHGSPPVETAQFLPWNMNELQKKILSDPPKYENSS
jgi:transposase